AGSIDVLREQIDARHPVIALIEDHRLRYHYVVVRAVDTSAVVVHDPAVGPSRRIPIDQWQRVWAPTHFWGLVILPGDEPPARTATPSSDTPSASDTQCD